MRRRLLLTLVFFTLGIGCSDVPPLGPIGQEREVASGWSVSHEVGHRFADGSPLLRVPLDVEGAVLVDVEPLISGAGLQPLGARMALPDRKRPLAGVQTVDSWPPLVPEISDIVAAVGATLSGEGSRGNYDINMGYALFVGFEVMAPGRTTVHGYRVIYEHRGRTYSLVLPHTLAVCAYEPGELPDEAECEHEYEVHLDHGTLNVETGGD